MLGPCRCVQELSQLGAAVGSLAAGAQTLSEQVRHQSLIALPFLMPHHASYPRARTPHALAIKILCLFMCALAQGWNSHYLHSTCLHNLPSKCSGQAQSCLGAPFLAFCAEHSAAQGLTLKIGVALSRRAALSKHAALLI